MYRSEPTSATEPEAADDASLLQGIAAGDAAALTRAYDRHVAPVYRFALSQLRRVEDAEDVTQEVFITLWSRAAHVRLVESSALPWLLVTARLKCANRRRLAVERHTDQNSSNSLERVEALNSPDAEVERRELNRAISGAIGALAPLDRELYRLCIEDGMSYSAAAASLSVTHGTVRNRLSRLRGKLQVELTEYLR